MGELKENLLDSKNRYKIIICLLAHEHFKEMNLNNWENILDVDSVIFDLKGIVPRELNPIRI